MPSIYHVRDISPQRLAKYLQVMLHENEQAPMFKSTWDYKKWAKDNANIRETEKRMHLNIQRLGETYVLKEIVICKVDSSFHFLSYCQSYPR